LALCFFLILIRLSITNRLFFWGCKNILFSELIFRFEKIEKNFFSAGKKDFAGTKEKKRNYKKNLHKLKKKCTFAAGFKEKRIRIIFFKLIENE